MKTKNSPAKEKTTKVKSEVKSENKENSFKSMNQIILTGNLGSDPGVIETKNGKKKAFFTLATNNFYYGKDGDQKKEPLWHSLVAWGKLAEKIETSLKMGDKVSVTGRINNRSYTDRNGVNKVFTEIILRSLDVLKQKEHA